MYYGIMLYLHLNFLGFRKLKFFKFSQKNTFSGKNPKKQCGGIYNVLKY